MDEDFIYALEISAPFLCRKPIWSVIPAPFNDFNPNWIYQ